MGGSSKGGGKVKNFYGSCAGVVCAGPVDELVSIIVDGTTVWPSKKHWANGCVNVPITSMQRSSNVARIELAAPMNFKKGGKIWVSGMADTSFNTGIAATVTNASATIVYYSSTGDNVTRTSVSAGNATVVLQYAEDSLILYAGGAWKAKSTHWGSPVQAPPNATYWESYSIPRATSANPYPITVEDYGSAYFYWGTDDQTLDASGEALLSKAGHPPYRRQAVLVLKDFLCGQERQAMPNVEVVVRRAPKQTVVTGTAANLADSQANPIAVACDLLTDSVFGLGQATGSLDATTLQAQADALEALASQAYLSPLVSAPGAARAFLAQLLAYYDGWLRWSASGDIEGGRFLHNSAPPTFTDANTIDYNDCIEEIAFDADGWAGTANEAICKFTDRARAFKDASRMAVSAFNREVTGEPRSVTLDRPFITREDQAADYAAEWGKIHAQPKIAGSLVVRAEKCTSIGAGDVFRLTHDALSFSVVCRCIEKSFAAPPAGRATLRFESERGVAPIPFQPTATAPEGASLPPAEPIAAYRLFQPPPSLTGDQDFRVAVLAARRNELTKGLYVWFKVDDSSGFYQLGEQRGWAVKGLLTQDYAATLPVAGTEPPDDDTETLQLDLDEFTVAADLSSISADQTDDAINDNSMLAVLFKADGSAFEICTLKAIRLDTVYKLKVRRARFGTSQIAFSTGDECWIVSRENLITYEHQKFASYAAASTAATFRLQSWTGYDEGDLADTDECPDIAFTFADPYAPAVTWTSVLYDGAALDTSSPVLPYGRYDVTFQITDANGDCTDARLVARSEGKELTLWTGAWEPSDSVLRSTQFTLPEGTWSVYLIARDRSGRVTESQLTVGGNTVTIPVQEEGSTLVATPAITPAVEIQPGTFTVTITCATAGATIYYDQEAYGAAQSGGWTTYSGPFSLNVSVPKRIYAKATKGGMTDSSVTYQDYRARPVR